MGMQQILDAVTADHLKNSFERFDVGDTVNIHVRIREGDKERIQVFQGVLIARKGAGVNEMITVRRVTDEIGIERSWPLQSPSIAKIDVVRRADARRAKLYYLRDRRGKSQRLRDRRRGMKHVEGLTVVNK